MASPRTSALYYKEQQLRNQKTPKKFLQALKKVFGGKEETTSGKGESGDTRAKSSGVKEESSGTKAESSDAKGESTSSTVLPLRPTIKESLLKFDPPKGWTNDPKGMLVEDRYKNADSEGYELLQELELKTATPIMSHTRQNGATLHIFESSGNYYLWNVIEGSASRFLNTSFEEILKTMTQDGGGVRRLQLETCV